MKKSITLLLLVLVALSGCKKDKVEDNSMQYTINGLSDITYKYTKQSIPVEIKYTSGNQEPVKLSVTGMPTGLGYTLSSSAGTPTFGAVLELTTTGILAKGTYPLKFTSTTNSGKVKSIDFKIIVENSCAEGLIGKYDDVQIPSSPQEYTVSTKADNPNRLYFYYEDETTPYFYGDIDCATGLITIPYQVTNSSGTYISGTGTYTFSPKAINLDLVFVYFGTNYPSKAKLIAK